MRKQMTQKNLLPGPLCIDFKVMKVSMHGHHGPIVLHLAMGAFNTEEEDVNILNHRLFVLETRRMKENVTI